MRPSRDEQLMMNALVAAMRSTCGRRQVGAVASLNGRPLSSGYAGPPSGADHCTPECVELHKQGCRRTIHAEQNAIAWAARHGVALHGAELHVTLSPCWECAGLIINSGIMRVAYLEQYRNPEGIYRLHDAGIQCEILSPRKELISLFGEMWRSGDQKTVGNGGKR
mgnify:CR=1 FL=1